jgi:Ni/Co efflux regulator RcnB
VPTVLKRLLLLALAITLVAAPIAQSAADPSPVAGAAKKKGKKCKGKKKKGKAAEAAKKKGKKCKKKSGGGGFPGKPLKPNPPKPPDETQPLLLSSLTLSENPLLAGTSGTAQVTVNAPAPAGGQVVTLGSGNPSRASVPDSVQIAPGQTFANVPVSTTAGPDDSVTITAATEFSTRNAQLDIVEEESLSSLALDYQCFPDDDLTDFGDNVVSLDVRAPTDVVVGLESEDPFSLAVPSSVTVLEGSFSGSFGVDTLQVSPPVTVTATYDDDVFTDAASVRNSGSPTPVAANLGLQPNSVVVGDPSTGTVSLDCEAPAGGITVNLASDHPGAMVPVSVFVPEGELSASFPITTDVATTPGPAVISATAGNTVQATLTLRAIGT